MTDLISLLHAASGLIILTEAHRRFEAARLTCSGLTRRQRASQVLHVAAWLLLAFPATLAVFAPVITIAGPPICWRGLSVDMVTPPSTVDVLVLAGFAALVMRDWLERACTR